jgi:hypothetical protein
MLQTKELYTVREKNFVSLLRYVVNQGYISSEIAREILSLWSTKSPEEQSKLTLRITNLLNSK